MGDQDSGGWRISAYLSLGAAFLNGTPTRVPPGARLDPSLRLLYGYGSELPHERGRRVVVDTPLESVSGWTADNVSKLKDVWITTAEQVVALGATKDGVRLLSEHLQVDLDEALQLLAAARAHLSPAVLRELDRPADTSDLGLGALPPRADDSDT